jgi:general secretion pathway protein H
MLPHTHLKNRGFTLIEASITVAIVAIAAGLVIPALNSASRADLRTASTLVAGEVKQCYDDAVLQGETFRIGFDIGNKTLVVESKEGTAFLSEEEEEAEEEGEESAPSGVLPGWMGIEPAPASEGDKGGATPSIGAFLGLEAPRKRGGGKFSTVRKHTLPEGVRILDVWTDVLDEPSSDGVVYLFLFPHGYTQDALIHLEDEDARNFTVSVDALTGRTSIEEGYLEVPR